MVEVLVIEGLLSTTAADESSNASFVSRVEKLKLWESYSLTVNIMANLEEANLR